MSLIFNNLNDKIRTFDLYVPNVARYRLRHIPIILLNCKFIDFPEKSKVTV